MASVKAFYCEECASPVPRNAKFCPVCGKRFEGVKCPRCGLVGQERDFEKGCPRCGYLTDGVLLPGGITPTAPKLPDGYVPKMDTDQESGIRKGRNPFAGNYSDNDYAKRPRERHPLPSWLYWTGICALIVFLGFLLYLYTKM